MQAIVYEGPDHLSVSERPPPTLEQDEVLLEVADFGVCWTASCESTARQREIAVEPLLNRSSSRTCCSPSRVG